MMPREEPALAELHAITLDLWGTIFELKDAEEKVEKRRAMILAALHEAGLDIDVPTLRAAYRAAHKIIEEDIGKERRDLGPPGRWSILCRQLELLEDAVPYSRIAAAYEDLTLEYPPPLIPGVVEAIERLAGRYRLGLICNTGYTGGSVLREVLRRYGLADYFKVLVFSNEFGWLKPDPRIFHHTLGHLEANPAMAAHVGDVEELDVHGALNAGMLAVRYLPGGPVPTQAHSIFHHWDEFEGALG
jgi:HAD superfamily hydrolase (TIGR01549 family)